MNVIDGFISDKVIEGEYIVLTTYSKLGFAYSISYRDAVSQVFLKKLPSFMEVYNYFMSCKSQLLKINKSQDICLSLFYNPYFSEFYSKLKTDIGNISKNRLKAIRRLLLAYLADPIQYKNIVNFDMADKEHYIKYNIPFDNYICILYNIQL